MATKNKLVRGVGVNDSPDPIYKKIRVNGKWKAVWHCPIYSVWTQMLLRATSEKYKQKHPTYAEVTVCEEWLKFTAFKLWWDKQPQGKDLELDKDLLTEGNKQYNPETCVLVPSQVNNLFLSREAMRGEQPLGVYCDSRKIRVRYVACIGLGFGRGQKYLGSFRCPKEAHSAWQKAKISCIKDVVVWYKEQDYYDARVEKVLENRANVILNQLLSGEETLSY